ncbi:hypothetical protein B0H13DRAFT_2305589 [Mycena leptocephala]|nr:hypothetical protein B0H13DRAFT_2305589 [Mycena leptocephala]
MDVVQESDTLHELVSDYRHSIKLLLNIEYRLMLQMAPDYENLPLLQKIEVFAALASNTVPSYGRARASSMPPIQCGAGGLVLWLALADGPLYPETQACPWEEEDHHMITMLFAIRLYSP